MLGEATDEPRAVAHILKMISRLHRSVCLGSGEVVGSALVTGERETVACFRVVDVAYPEDDATILLNDTRGDRKPSVVTFLCVRATQSDGLALNAENWGTSEWSGNEY